MSYRALFFDLDGTLTSLKDHRVPDSAKQALAEAKRNGVKIFLATGRHPLMFHVKELIEELDFDAHLTANGQFCYNKQEIIYRKGICREDKKGLLDLLDKEAIPVLFLTEKELYMNMADERVVEANRILEAEQMPVKATTALMDETLFALLLYGGNENDAAILEAMPSCQAVRWHPAFTDIIPRDGGKNNGIDAMLAYYGICLSETMAFGDAHNDMAMLKHVGMGVAMGNAADEVKRCADYITTPAEEDGIYLAMKKCGVI